MGALNKLFTLYKFPAFFRNIFVVKTQETASGRYVTSAAHGTLCASKTD